MNTEILNKYIELINKGYCEDCNELNCIGNFPHKEIAKNIKDILEENQQLKEQLNKYTDPKDLTLMFMYCDEKAKDKIKCLEQENQQLKEELKQKEDIINKAIEFINKYNGSTWYQISISIISELLELLDNKGKDI